MPPTKVFVGNLSFKTGEAELAQEFAIAGKVLSANIISRGPRSLGYGFVELEGEDEANKAVSFLNKKEIDGRQINVEVARPRVERPEGEAAPPRRGGSRGGRGGRGSGRGAGRGRARGGRRGRGRGGLAGTSDRPADAPAAADASPTADAAEGGGRGARRRRGGSRGRGAGAGRGRGRGGSARRTDDGPREESETTLFVANLPFSVTDDQLKAEFSSDGLAVKGAHVVTRVTGRSKGYGFVDYETKSDQARALQAFANKTIDARELIVKIALKDNRPPAEAGQGTDAPATN